MRGRFEDMQGERRYIEALGLTFEQAKEMLRQDQDDRAAEQRRLDEHLRLRYGTSGFSNTPAANWRHRLTTFLWMSFTDCGRWRSSS